MKLTKYILFCLLIVLGKLTFSQEKKIDFYGAGRFNMLNSGIEGNILKQDTTTPRKQQIGNVLFDLGFHIRPNENTEIKATTRVQNDLNGFWGAGISYQLRELYLRGLLFKKLSFQVGDLNTKMTPLTLYNNTEENGELQPKALRLFQEVNHYDKFYINNAWRQQGAQGTIVFDFKTHVNYVKVSGLITKNKQTDYFSVPDRLFSGLSINSKLMNHLQIGYHLAHTFDVKNTAMFGNTLFKNTVQTIVLNDEHQFEKWKVGLAVELGNSNVNYTGYTNSLQVPDGNCFNGKISFNHKKNRISFDMGLNYVSSNFRSMGSQSRRINWNQIASQFPYYTNREIPRPAGLIEAMTDPNYLNTQLNPQLGYFDPQYENIRPYGMATPNRKGFVTTIGWKHPFHDCVQLDVSYLNENEITGQGTHALRNFAEIKAQSKFLIHEFYGGKKNLNLEISYKNQQTNRAGQTGIDAINLKSEMLKLGIDYLLYEQLSIELAAITFTASGNEVIANRNNVNEIDFYSAYQTQLKERIYVGGLNYQFGENTHLKLQYQQANRANELDTEKNYTLNRFAVLYSLFF
jgi:hypothetical protein